MDLFNLMATLGLDSSGYEKGLDDAEGKAGSFGSKLKSGLGTAAKVGAAAVTTVATATAGATAALVKGASETAAYGDNVDKMSQKLGLSAEAYQEWDYIIGQAGGDIDSMATGLKTLTNKIDDARNGSESAQQMFAKLGISMEDLTTMSREDIFAATISGFQQLEDSTERAALANDLYGKSGQNLTPLFNSSIEDTEALRQAAHDLGFVMSDENVKASADFADALDTMQRSLGGLKRSITGQFMPALTSVMSGLAEVFGGNTNGGLAQIEEGISSLADNIVQKAPEMFNIGGTIIKALAKSITANLPTLLQAAVPIMGQLVGAILDLAPDIISAAFTLLNSIIDWLVNGEGLSMLIDGIVTLITSLADALSENISTIIPNVVAAIMQVVTALTDPEIIVGLTEAAISLITELANGLINAIPIIIENLPTIIDNICQGLLEGLPLILDAGIQLFMAIIQALPTILESLGQNLPMIIDTVVNFLIQSMPMILQGAIQLFMAIIQALPTIITTLVQQLPTIITTTVSTLLRHLPELIQGAVQLFMGIVKAIPKIVVELVKQLPTIIKTIVNGLLQGIGDVAKVGLQLVQGLWQGISNATQWVLDKIRGFGESILNGIKSIFGIHSPSRVFRDQIGKNLALGLGEGFEEGMDDVSSDMIKEAGSLADDISKAMTLDDLETAFNDMTANVGAIGSLAQSASNGLTTGGNGVIINVYGAEGQDVNELADVISERLAFVTQQERAVWA